MMNICTVILAAGHGNRMQSVVPKVLHQLAGKSLLEHICITATNTTSTPPVIVTGFKAELVKEELQHLNATWVHQDKQLGTGHALQTALPTIPDNTRVLVLYGDVPLTSKHTLEQLIATTPENAIGFITAEIPDPTGLGRIVRDANEHVVKIVEEKDANEEIRSIHEINSGIYLIPKSSLDKFLPKLSRKNSQGEYYLTDIIPLAITDKISIHTIQPENTFEIAGINTRSELAEVERYFQYMQAENLMEQGVTITDPARIDIRGTVTAGQDCFIDINVILEGQITLGKNVRIGANCILRDVQLGDDSEICANSIVEDTSIANDCRIGPFARIRPGTRIDTGAKIGNFVEIKKSQIGAGSKVSHLSYIGDCKMGTQVNIGAGTITCNYDGHNKHLTQIGDNVFIGSNTALIAPVDIYNDATVGAGSTITRDAPANQLTISRAPQRSLSSWKRPEKNTEEV